MQLQKNSFWLFLIVVFAHISYDCGVVRFFVCFGSCLVLGFGCFSCLVGSCVFCCCFFMFFTAETSVSGKKQKQTRELAFPWKPGCQMGNVVVTDCKWIDKE